MKMLLPILCLLTTAACSPASTEKSTPTDTDPGHAAVMAYIRKNADDPASYQPVRFSKEEPFTRSDSAYAAAAKLIKSNIKTEREKGYALMDGPAKDTATQLGKRYIHAYRLKNKLGALVLDSAQFAVLKNGQVQAL